MAIPTIKVKVKAIPFSGANTLKIEDNLVVICDCNLVIMNVKYSHLKHYQLQGTHGSRRFV